MSERCFSPDVIKTQAKSSRHFSADFAKARSLSKRIGAQSIGLELLVTHTLGGVSSDVKKFERFRMMLLIRFGAGPPMNIHSPGIQTITESIIPPAERVAEVTEYADHVVDAADKSIGIVVGTNDLSYIWLGESIVEGNMIAQRSKLGWLTFGK